MIEDEVFSWDVAGDKRLQRRPGNPGSTVGQFISQINMGEGVARPNRYLVRFWLNSKLKTATYGSGVNEGAPPPYRENLYTQSF